ncbi:anaphase-promoting complex subunit 1 isoform X4 [Phymastichus coffea]|uniref:anaphase-promoting complex subunit 1 isoform X4 n=1 Tax=Phymastichus coffea TaxID=108790 RepID=UPI00273BA74D|nr:anaphase-promoting complex subunit 1 isoform X4 [Phymastichus coffea]
MINSSDAVEFTPIGRNRILNHPENRMKRDAKIDKNIHIQAVSNEFLDIDIEKSNDFWSLRVNKENQEEELYCYHNLAIYSKGKQDGISSQTSFCCESKITHALWCTFYVEDKYKSSKTISNNLEKIDTTSVDCICLFDTYTMNVHTENGENYVSSLPFKVCAVWPTKYGILVEKAVTAPLQQGLSTMDTTKHVPESDDSDLPIMHSLSHPLDDTRPVLIKHGNSTYLWQHHLKIIFTSLEPSFAFVYDTRTGSHSIYKIRKITKEEELLFPHQSENISTNISTIPSFYITETTFGMKKTKRTASSPFYSRTSHTTNCSANVSFSSQHLSRSHSPMATISRCQSPTNPMFSGMNNSSIACYPMYSKTHQAILATSSGPSEHSDIILDGRNNQYSDYMLTATIKPELCLEHVWTENPRTFKDGDFERASKVFLTTDLLGQVYFCYLIRNQSRLFLARIEKSNDPNQIILGMLYSVTAKDAISLQILRLRFNTDHRVREIRKLLDSSEPMIISIVQRPDVSDHEFIEEQEKFLHALCTRTMALPIGRGMFTLRTSMPINTEQLPIPRLCLTGKAPPRGTTVELTHIDVPPNMNLWPLFHNGVATGLCIHPSALNVDSTWIVYNKQHQSELGIEHSGFLMALGLNGHLKNLAPFSMYEYLVECHETTSVGLLLGLSATYRSSMDVSMTKLLSLHVETLLPPTSIELNVQQNVQVAALMGVGLVYQKTSHRHIAYALLSEIGRPPGPEMKNCVDRESYSLTAGLALGLVVLCSGGGSDLAGIPDTLHYYMIGGNTRPFGGAQKDKYKSPSYQIKEGDSINVDITSPGATLALGLMYLQTGNRPVADWMTAPDTNYLLDFVRPDFLLLRILAKSLILWNEIEPSKTWVSSHVPDIVAKYKLQKPSSNQEEQIDWETINQAYCNIIAGGCMALGIRFAGTENMIAFKTLYHFLKMFMTLTQKSMADLLGRATIESCLNVVLLSASLVMAGTGNLELIRVCRHIRERVGPTNSVVTYGSHVATHMALGFLVLGGGAYTLSNDPTSVAALIISLFPKFPIHSNDNRYHLQALRHFYVLATQPRLLLPKDIDTKQFCYVNVRLTFESISQKEGQKIILKAPCLLPQLDRLNKIEVDDDRYWRIIFEKGRNFDQLTKILEDNCVLDVKQRAGCLSRVEDPQGFRTLLAQTLTTDDVIVWTASLKQITSFTTDSIMLYFVDSFLKKHDSNDFMQYDRCCKNIKHKKLSAFCINKFNKFTIEKLEFDSQLYQIRQDMSYIENRYLQNLIIIAYECVIRDKISLLPLWFDIYKSAISLKVKANPSLIWQIKFLCLPSLYKDYCSDLERLINIENILANKQQISLQMDSWESDLSECLSQWVDFEHSKISIQNIERIIGYKINYDVPSSQCTIIKRLEYPIDGPTMSCLKVYGTLKYNSFFKFG